MNIIYRTTAYLFLAHAFYVLAVGIILLSISLLYSELPNPDTRGLPGLWSVLIWMSEWNYWVYLFLFLASFFGATAFWRISKGLSGKKHILLWLSFLIVPNTMLISGAFMIYKWGAEYHYSATNSVISSLDFFGVILECIGRFLAAIVPILFYWVGGPLYLVWENRNNKR